MVPMTDRPLLFGPGMKDRNPKGIEVTAGEVLETNEPHSALPTCCLQVPPTSVHLIHTRLQTSAPTKICSGLSKLDVVKNSEPDLLMYVMAITEGITLHFLQTLVGEDTRTSV